MRKAMDVITQCVADLRSGSVVLFVGAGISHPPPSNLHLARDLCISIIAELCTAGAGRSETLTDFFQNESFLIEKIASTVPPEFIYQTLFCFVTRYGGHPVIQADDATPIEPLPVCFESLLCNRPNKNHELISALAKCGCIECIITTNFDILLETSLEREGVGYSVYFGDEDVKPNAMTLRIYKIHGCITQRDSLVYTLAQVGRGLPPKKKLLLSNLLRNHPFLFMGWSDNDIDITPIILQSASRIYWVVHSEPSASPDSWQLVSHIGAQDSQLSRIIADQNTAAWECNTTSLLSHLVREVCVSTVDNSAVAKREDISGTTSENSENCSVARMVVKDKRKRKPVPTERTEIPWFEWTRKPERILAMSHLLATTGELRKSIDLLEKGMAECSNWNYPPALGRLRHQLGCLLVRSGDVKGGMTLIRDCVSSWDTVFPYDSLIAILNLSLAYILDKRPYSALQSLALFYNLYSWAGRAGVTRFGIATYMRTPMAAQEKPIIHVLKGRPSSLRELLVFHVAGLAVCTSAATLWQLGRIKESILEFQNSEIAFLEAGSLVEAGYITAIRCLCRMSDRNTSYERDMNKLKEYCPLLDTPVIDEIVEVTSCSTPHASVAKRRDKIIYSILARLSTIPVYPDIAEIMRTNVSYLGNKDVESSPASKAYDLITSSLDVLFTGWIHPLALLIDYSQNLTSFLPPVETHVDK